MKIKLLFLTVLTMFTMTSVFASFPVQRSVTSSNQVTSVSEEEVEEFTTPAASTSDRRTVSIILALVSVILLPLGIHNWYLGRKKQALWQTLLVIPGFLLLVPPLVSWVWQIVDTIRILGKDPEFD